MTRLNFSLRSSLSISAKKIGMGKVMTSSSTPSDRVFSITVLNCASRINFTKFSKPTHGLVIKSFMTFME